MNDREMPDDLMQLILSALPPEPEPSPQGGRPRVSHEVILQVIWFAMKTGTQWRMIPKAMGCSGKTVRIRIIQWSQVGIWDRVHEMILKALNAAGELDLDTMVVDGQGVPLEVRVAPANRSDQVKILSIVVELKPIGGRPGRPQTRAKQLYADAGYDNDATRKLLSWPGIKPFPQARPSSRQRAGSSSLCSGAHHLVAREYPPLPISLRSLWRDDRHH